MQNPIINLKNDVIFASNLPVYRLFKFNILCLCFIPETFIYCPLSTFNYQYYTDISIHALNIAMKIQQMIT